jgi:type II secretion system protein N
MVPFRVPEQVREPLIWCSGAVALFILFVMTTFPYGVLHARILAEFTRASGMDIRVGDWSAGFPAAVEWRDIVLAGSRAGPIQVDSLQARMAVLPAVMGTVAMDILVHFPKSGQPEQGRIKGMVKAASWSLQGPMELKAEWQRIELSSLLKQYVSRGFLQGEGLHRWDSTASGASGLKGEGTWKAEIRELGLESFPIGQATSPSLFFTRVTAVVTCHQSLCDVTELKGQGPDGSFAIQGQVTVQRPVEKSTLALNVSVSPGTGLSQKLGSLGLPPFQAGVPLSFKIVGSADDPRVAF